MATTKKKEQQYFVTEDFKANVNERSFNAKRGDKIVLTPIEYSVLKRFVMPV